MTSQASHVIRDLWQTDRPLTAIGFLMLGALGAAALGLWLDPRAIGGAPAWLKPAKFAASFVIYAFTFAWLFRYLGPWQRTRRMVSWTTAAVLAIEFAIIATQAWRGTTSHFNVSTPLDTALFGTMGAAIFLQTAVSMTVAVALWRARFADPALGWALRLGMILTIVGASTGGLMVRPTHAQLADARAGRGMPVSGAHSVSGPDGGAGMPGTGWSAEHGDLRVPHFVGLHGIQALGLFAFFFASPRRVRLVLAAASSYTALFAVLLWQALRGQSILQPDSVMLAVSGGWLVATAAAMYAATRSTSLPRPALVY